MTFNDPRFEWLNPITDTIKIRWGLDPANIESWTTFQEFNISKVGQKIILQEKQPNTVFHIQVCFWGEQAALSEWSEIEQARTDEATPTGEPQNLILKALDSTIIAVSWEKPAEDKRHGRINGYMIKYKKTQDENEWHPIGIDASETTLEIAHLEAYTVYDIQVFAKNKKGPGPAAEKEIRTLAGQPSPAHKPTVSNGEDSRSLVIEFEKPLFREIKGRLLNYVLHYEMSDASDAPKEITIPPSEQRYVLRDLEPFTRYNFKLKYRNHGEPPGEGDWSPQVGWETGEELPTTAITISGSTPRTDSTYQKHTIQLSWEMLPRSQLRGHLKQYIVEWKADKESTWERKEVVDIQNTDLKELQAWTSYDIRIAAENGAGVGPFGEVSVKTTEGNPGKAQPPVLIVTSSSSITAKMKIPSDEAAEVGGALKCFKIRYIINGSATEATIHPTCVSPKEDASETEYKLEGLKAHTTYKSKWEGNLFF